MHTEPLTVSLQVATSIPAPVRARPVWLIPALLLSVFVGQCLWFIGSQSLTFDEPIHMLTGANALHFDYNVWNDHPPLARVLFALPLVARGFWIDYSGISPGAIHVHGVGPSPQAAAWLTRPVNVVLGVGLALLLWFEARRRWSAASANFILALFVLTPGIVAHFSQATTDGAGILSVFALAVMAALWRRIQSWRNTLALAVVCGLALLAKFYTLPLVAIAVLLVLVSSGEGFAWRPRDWRWRHALAMVAIIILVVWSAYGFRLTTVRVKQGVAVAFIPGRKLPIVFQFDSPVDFTARLPAGEYADGLRYVRGHNFFGHPNYLFGRVSRQGWWFYYPALVALKWPLLIVAMAIAGWLLAVRRGWLTRETTVFGIFPVAFVVVALFSHIQIGDRHFLPVYPFLLLGAGALWHEMRMRRLWRLLLLALVTVQAVLTFRIAPDYLSYFNFVSSERAWRLTSDSNLDWGQGLIALRRWQQSHPGPLHLAYFGSLDPALYGIQAQTLLPGQRVTGAVAVSMTNLSGQYLEDPASYRWLLAYPHTVVNHSIVVFFVGDQPQQSTHAEPDIRIAPEQDSGDNRRQ